MKNTKLRIRKSLRTFYILLCIAVIIICSMLIYGKIVERNKVVKQEILSYSNKLDTNYAVNLKENPYILEKILPMGKVYVTDLIDSIDMNLNYEYTATEDANIKYQYRIVGLLGAYYTSNGTEQKVWEKEYELKPMIESVTKGKEFKISELINIDLDTYNNEIESFEKEYGITLRSNLLIQLEVSMVSEVDSIKFDNNYFTNIQIGLGEKTTQVQGDLEEIESDTIKQEYTRIENGDIIAIILYIAVIVISAVCLRFVIFNTKSINVLKNLYKVELNRILKSCDEKIVKLNKKLDLEDKEIIEVKDFGELIKLSEELYKPVLYWEVSEKEEAEFFIIASNIIYRFRLEVK